MYCSSCGVQVSDAFRYCPQCGTQTGGAASGTSTIGRTRNLRRSREDKKIAGVCAGIAHYLGIDVTLVRVLMVVFAIWPPAMGLIIYAACWMVMPQEPLLLPPPSQPASGEAIAAS